MIFCLEPMLTSNQCRIKFRLDDGSQILGTFAITESVADLFAFLKTVLIEDKEPYTLELLPMRTKLFKEDPGELWRDFYFGPATLCQVIGKTCLKPQYRQKAQDISLALAAIEKQGEIIDTHTQESGKLLIEKSNNEKTISARGIPKWLKLGKK